MMKLLSLNEVCKKTSLSRTTINNHRSKNAFPEAVHLSETRIAFVETEVDDWIAERIAARRTRPQEAA